MAIIARCQCGNRVSLADALAGRTIPCPKCGGNIDVPMSSAPAPAAAMKKKMDAAGGPSIAINPAIIAAVVIVAGVLITVITLWLGPWSVSKQWEAMTPKANSDVTDVVLFAVKAYESQHGLWDAASMHHSPDLEGAAVFRPPGMVMSLPRKILFGGTTNRGHYEGHYDTTTGEIDANIEAGGTNIAGLADVKKASETFSITGRVKDGTCTAECDGEPMKIVERRLPARGEE